MVSYHRNKDYCTQNGREFCVAQHSQCPSCPEQASAGPKKLTVGPPDYNKADEEPQAGDVRINAKGDFEAYVKGLGWIPASETQYSIATWAEQTFGPLFNMSAVSVRANLEMGELLRATQALDNYVRGSNEGERLTELKNAVAEEGADVIITLMRMFSTLGVDYRAEINKKMQTNRGRKWVVGPDGTGQHVRTRDLKAVAGVTGL